MSRASESRFTAYFPLSSYKIPTQGWRLAKPQKTNLWPTRYGINLYPGELIIDVDPRRYNNNVDALELLKKHFELEKTRTVRTPQGGFHLYYYFPPELTIRSHQPPYTGVDFLTSGRFSCGPGTINMDGVYTLIDDSPIADLPLDMALSLEPKPNKQTRRDLDCEYEDDRPEDIDAFEAFLYRASEAIQGQHGNDKTYSIACFGRDYGLSQDRVYECMFFKYNPKCKPPWSESELLTIINSAFRSAQNPLGIKSIHYDKLLSELSKEIKPTKLKGQYESKASQLANLRFSHLRNEWIRDAKGALVENNKINARLILQHDNRFKDLFYWDDFANEARFNRAPWWQPDKAIYSAVNDDDIRQVEEWFAGKAKTGDPYKINNMNAWFAVHQVAFMNARHPIKEYLESLAHDGISRLDKILIRTCQADDTEYTRLVGKNMLISAIARIYQPGCLVKNVLILEGEQNKQKSMWIDELGAPWSCTGVINPQDKDTYLNLLGHWIVELPEINQTLSKRDVNAVKAIISTREDSYRAPYDRKGRKVPRQSIYIGSINPTSIGYLSDETGDTRYWPVRINYCDVGCLRMLKDQYFAEALCRYKAGERWWLDENEEKLAKQEQDKRKRIEPLTVMLCTLLENVHEIETNALFKLVGKTMDKVTTQDYVRLGAALSTLGFKRKDFYSWERIR